MYEGFIDEIMVIKETSGQCHKAFFDSSFKYICKSPVVIKITSSDKFLLILFLVLYS